MRSLGTAERDGSKTLAIAGRVGSRGLKGCVCLGTWPNLSSICLIHVKDSAFSFLENTRSGQFLGFIFWILIVPAGVPYGGGRTF